VLTYNILRAATAGQYAGDGTIASWSERRAGVAKLINAAVPDIVAVQEGSDWAGSIEGRGGTRQVDDLTRALGGAFALARTEIPPTEAGYFRTGRYLLYRSSAYRAYGAGGYWTIGDKRYAAYQVLQHRTSGAKLLAVSVHLSNAPGTATGDAERKAETESLLKQASAYAASHRVPVVYAGDFNSHGGSNHAYDGPAIAMRAVRATDALQVAQSKTNSSYNSATSICAHRRAPVSASTRLRAAGRGAAHLAPRPVADRRQVRRLDPVGPQPAVRGRDVSVLTVAERASAGRAGATTARSACAVE
jgi:endonuclease/exonuclease/phosphatase family metal-dependent hydrolase